MQTGSNLFKATVSSGLYVVTFKADKDSARVCVPALKYEELLNKKTI